MSMLLTLEEPDVAFDHSGSHVCAIDLGTDNFAAIVWQNGQNQMMPQDGMGPNNGQHMHSNGQMPMQGQPPQQPNGNAPQQQTDQGAPQTTQN